MRVSVRLWRRQFTLCVDRRPEKQPVGHALIRLLASRGVPPHTFPAVLGVSNQDFANAVNELPGGSRRIRRTVALVLGYRSWRSLARAIREPRRVGKFDPSLVKEASL